MGGVFLPGEEAVLVDVALSGETLADHPVEVRDHQIAAMGLCGPDQRAGGVWGDPVITVQKLEIDALSQIQGMVAGGGDPGVFLVDRSHPGIPGGKFIADRAGAVGAAVVHQKQLQVGKLLVQDAGHTAPDGLFRIVNRHNDADHWFHFSNSLF